MPALCFLRSVMTWVRVVESERAYGSSGDNRPTNRSRLCPLLSASGAAGTVAVPSRGWCFWFEDGSDFGSSPHVVLTARTQTKNRAGIVGLGECPAPPGTFIRGQRVAQGRAGCPTFQKPQINGAQVENSWCRALTWSSSGAGASAEAGRAPPVRGSGRGTCHGDGCGCAVLSRAAW